MFILIVHGPRDRPSSDGGDSGSAIIGGLIRSDSEQAVVRVIKRLPQRPRAVDRAAYTSESR